MTSVSIGGMVDILLFGVMITQAYYYFTQFKRCARLASFLRLFKASVLDAVF